MLQNSFDFVIIYAHQIINVILSNNSLTFRIISNSFSNFSNETVTSLEI